MRNLLAGALKLCGNLANLPVRLNRPTLVRNYGQADGGDGVADCLPLSIDAGNIAARAVEGINTLIADPMERVGREVMRVWEENRPKR